MRKIENLNTYLELDPSELANTQIYCPRCDSIHKVPIEIVSSGRGNISSLDEIVRLQLNLNPKKVGIVYDRHIEEKLESIFFPSFKKLGFTMERLPLGNLGEELDSTIALGDAVAQSLDSEIDLLIGVGSGVICDLAKWIATKRDIPFILIGTAGSMNAYTSISATMAQDNIKSSINLHPAQAVLLDVDLLVTAPLDMTWAGIGDLLARNVCNADWQLSNLLRGTYFCSVPYDLMIKSQDKYLSKIELLGKNDQDAMALFADALLLSGYSMTILDGLTSSSSGSEHVISHFFDFQHKLFGHQKNYHGTQVGVGTIIMNTAYDMLREMKPSDFAPKTIIEQRPTLEAVRQRHHREFGDYSGSFDKVITQKRIRDDKYPKYLNKILDNWEAMWDKLDRFLMPSKKLRSLMKESGAVTKLSALGRSKDDAIQALLFGSSYRPRYTVLDLIWELGLFPDLAADIIVRSEV